MVMRRGEAARSPPPLATPCAPPPAPPGAPPPSLSPWSLLRRGRGRAHQEGTPSWGPKTDSGRARRRGPGTSTSRRRRPPRSRPGRRRRPQRGPVQAQDAWRERARRVQVVGGRARRAGRGGHLGEHGLDDRNDDVEGERKRRGELHHEGLVLLGGAIDQRRVLL